MNQLNSRFFLYFSEHSPVRTGPAATRYALKHERNFHEFGGKFGKYGKHGKYGQKGSRRKSGRSASGGPKAIDVRLRPDGSVSQQ